MSVGTLLCSEDCKTFSPHKVALIRFVIAVIKFMFSPLTFFLTLELPSVREKEKTCHSEKFGDSIIKSVTKQDIHQFQKVIYQSVIYWEYLPSYVQAEQAWRERGRRDSKFYLEMEKN